MARAALLIVFALLLGLPARASSGAAAKIKNTGGWIESLAMDGPRVAYAVHNPDCTKVIVWNVVTQGAKLVSGKRTCGADSTSTGAGVREIAVAGSAVAWIVNLGGNTESNDYLYAATLPEPKERLVATSHRTGDIGGVLTGGWIGGLVGDSGVLAVNTWRTEADGSMPTATLRRVSPREGKPVPIATSLAAYRAAAVDGERIAVARTDNSVALYSVDGTLLREIVPSSEQEVALEGGDLVVLTKAKTVEVYSAATGKARASWPVAGGASHVDVSAGIAVYAVGRDVHELRLVDGKDAVVATAPREIEALQIETPGIVYAYNTVRNGKDIGNLAFVPRSRATGLLG